MPSHEKRTPNQPEEVQVRGAAQRLMREGAPLDHAEFRETDTPEFIEKVRQHGQAIFGQAKSAEDLRPEGTERGLREKNDWPAAAEALTPEQTAIIFSKLEARFSKKPEHYKRAEGVDFAEVKKALEASPALLASLARMEQTGGEPDVVAVEGDTFVFADCSDESPAGRRDVTYDEAAAMAKKFGVEMMPETVYRAMQKTGKLDRETWSWLATPADIREAGLALNGARDGREVLVHQLNARNRDSYGGWRGVLRVKKA